MLRNLLVRALDFAVAREPVIVAYLLSLVGRLIAHFGFDVDPVVFQPLVELGIAAFFVAIRQLVSPAAQKAE